MGDYSGERYNPSLPHCGVLTLFFDGYYLRLNGGSRALSYPAVSGRPVTPGRFDYSVARQRLAGTGPIPEGTYWIRPDELDDNYLGARNAAQRRLDGILHGAAAGLRLPAEEPAAVVFDAECDAHE